MKKTFVSGGLLIIGLIIIILCLRWHRSEHFRIRRSEDEPDKVEKKSTFQFEEDNENNLLEFSFEDFDFYYHKIHKVENEKNIEQKAGKNIIKSDQCRMNNCFDFEVCRKNGFKDRSYFIDVSTLMTSVGIESIL